MVFAYSPTAKPQRDHFFSFSPLLTQKLCCRYQNQPAAWKKETDFPAWMLWRQSAVPLLGPIKIKWQQQSACLVPGAGCEQGWGLQPLGYFAGELSLAAAELDILKHEGPFLHPARCSEVSRCLLMVGLARGLKDSAKALLLLNSPSSWSGVVRR